ncbi:MAG: hypothetical protein ACRBN8_02335 [Nannocystales bacterium]
MLSLHRVTEGEGKLAEFGPERCMFGITSSEPADGYSPDWALE